MRIMLQSRLFTDGDQVVDIRDDLYVRELITVVRSRYGLTEGSYVLRLGTSLLLDPNRTFSEQGVRSNLTLIFSQEDTPDTSFLTKPNLASAFFKMGDGRVFGIMRNPAFIGRPKEPQYSASKLDIDLSLFDPHRTVSRPHARVTHEGSSYYIESMASNNLTYLNNQPVPVNEKRRLTGGDYVRIGEIVLVFHLQNIEPEGPTMLDVSAELEDRDKTSPIDMDATI
jgi:hypothetical protein